MEISNFQTGTQEDINVLLWIIIGFQQQNGQRSQNLNNDSFCRLPVVSAQCIIGTGNYPDSAILLNYDDDDYSQGYGQFKEASSDLTKDDILKPYISDHDFRSSNECIFVGYNFYVLDTRYQKISQFLNQLKKN